MLIFFSGKPQHFLDCSRKYELREYILYKDVYVLS